LRIYQSGSTSTCNAKERLAPAIGQMRSCPYSFRGCRSRGERKRCRPRTKKLETMRSRPISPSHNLAAGKNELELPMAKPLINRMRPTQIRVRETGSGSFGSIGGEDGPATMWLSRSVTCVVSQARIPSNYNSTKVCFAYFAFCTGGSLGKTKAWILPYGRLRSSTSRNCSTRCELRSAVCRSFTLTPRREPLIL
jgi:hypothetical protein